MKKILVCLLFLPVSLNMDAQNTRNAAVAALNLYVDYCNETIHGLWSVTAELRGFNQSLDYHRQHPESKIYLSFQKEDVFHNASYYERIPDEVYKDCLTRSKLLGLPTQTRLNEKLTAVKNTITRLETELDSVFQYTEQKKFVQDTGFENIYNLLFSIENTFRQYRQAKNDLVAAVQEVYEKAYKPTAASPQQKIIQATARFTRGLQVCKKLLDETADNNTTHLAAYVSQLDSLIADLKASQAKNLEGLYRFGRNNGLDPDWRYERVTDNLESIRKHAQSLLGKSESYRSGGYYQPFPLSFYYYNENLLNKYNRYGLGVVRDFNEFIELSNGKAIQQTAGIDDYYIKNGSVKLDNAVLILLKWAEEPHLFRVMPVPGQMPHPTPEKPVLTRPPELDLTIAEVGQPIRLQNIYFKVTEFELLPASFTELDKIVAFMQLHPQAEIRLEGHTDILGNPDDNLKLSENRVKAVKNYLVQQGISGKRIQLNWYGSTRPLKTDGTPEERKINRRVEFVLLRK